MFRLKTFYDPIDFMSVAHFETVALSFDISWKWRRATIDLCLPSPPPSLHRQTVWLKIDGTSRLISTTIHLIIWKLTSTFVKRHKHTGFTVYMEIRRCNSIYATSIRLTRIRIDRTENPPSENSNSSNICSGCNTNISFRFHHHEMCDRNVLEG